MSDSAFLPPTLLWQRYAAARHRILTGAANRVPQASLAAQARALGLWNGREPMPGDEAQHALLMDLAVFEPTGGHTRALDRQARAEEPAPGSPDAVMLAALLPARVGLWRLLGTHPEGGVRLAPMAGPDHGEPAEIWVMDRGLPQTAPGAGLAARLAWPEGAGFALTCGAIAPCDTRVLQRVLMALPASRDPVVPTPQITGDAAVMDRLLTLPATRERLAALLAAGGIAAPVYRAAIDLGLMGPVPGRTPEQGGSQGAPR
jgi:hypothetical protein